MSLLRLSRLILLLFIAVAYLLGAAVADYLTIELNLTALWLGLAILLLAQVSLNFLVEVFRPFNEPIVPGETRLERVRLREKLLVTSLGLLGLAAAGIYSLFVLGRLHSSAIAFLGLSFLVVITCAVPPFSLIRRGFAELLTGLQVGYVSLSLGFLLQAGVIHRLLPILALPITALALASFLAFDF